MTTETKGLQKRQQDTRTTQKTNGSHTIFKPLVDVIETNNDYILLIDMPGVNEKTIEVSLDKNELKIRGETNIEFPTNMNPIWREYQIGNYERSFLINESINSDKIDANYNHGVLEIKLPKTEEVKPKEIEIKTE